MINISVTKKKTIVLMLVSSMILGGCSTVSSDNFAERTANVQEANDDSSAEELTKAAPVADEEDADYETVLEEIVEDTESWESIDDESEDIFESEDEVGDTDEPDMDKYEIDESEIDESDIDDSDFSSESVTSMRRRIREIKERDNHDPINLKPSVGEFCVMDESGLDIITTPDGNLYGFVEDLTGGCSVWCAVQGYNVDVEASSVLAPQGSHSYEAENVINGYRESGWVEGVKGNGIGESISITKSYDVDAGRIVPDEESIFFTELCIVNGLARTDKTFRENGRVKSLKFFYNGEDMGTIELEDTMKPQYISLSGLNLGAKNQESVNFTFEIEDVYPGGKYEDTAITGIEIAFDTPNH